MLSATYSPADIAERWGCKVDKILTLIASRQLIAINVATNRNGGKPRWRISPEALDDFEQSRMTQPKAKPIIRRRSKRPEVKSYF